MYKDKESCSLSLRELKHTIGNYFCISNECLEDFLLELRTVSDIFVYNDTAGVSELAIKNNNLQIRNKLLKRHYGIHGYEMEQYIKSLENEPVAPAEVVKQYSLMF